MAKQTLGQGGIPKDWGFPSPLYNLETGQYDSRGMVWQGKKPATKEDVAALRERFGAKTKIDGNSKRGRKAPNYNTFYSRNVGKGPYKQHLVLK